RRTELIAALKAEYEKEGIELDTKGAGLKTKIPFIQKVKKFDRRLLEYDDIPRSCPTGDKQFILIDNFARWRIIDPLKFMKTVASETRAQTRLDDIVFPNLKKQVGKNNLYEVIRSINRPVKIKGIEGEFKEKVLDEIKIGRQKIMEEVTRQSDGSARAYGIMVHDVRIKRADLPKEVKASVLQRMESERKRISTFYRAEGEREARKIWAQMGVEVKETISSAERDAFEIRGEADAEAIKIYAESYSQDPEFYRFTKMLETYKKSFAKKTKFIMSTDSEFLNLLKEIESKKGGL
ncbi:MAG: protease modulator HflC, partial [Thermoplasmata archaeon]|nr:protease modulator HflC [Thermoplasmata archaeon]